MEISIGNFKLEVPAGHGLPEIYRTVPTYDFFPWNVIARLVELNQLELSPLIDIGANIGDTIAHFRRFSAAMVRAVEPDPKFFSVLARNTRQFSNITLLNKLACPYSLVGKVSFESNLQTGTTTVSAGHGTWLGQSVAMEELLAGVPPGFIIKSDTDGFDAHVIIDLERVMGAVQIFPSIVYFEGASEPQMRASDFSLFVDASNRLQSAGYEILLLSNFGLPYAYAGLSHRVVSSAFASLAASYSIGRAFCHYFDILAVRSDLCTAPLLPPYALPSGGMDA